MVRDTCLSPPLPWTLGLPREVALPPPHAIGRGRAETPPPRQPPARTAPGAALAGGLPASLPGKKGPLGHLRASTSLTGGVRAGLPMRRAGRGRRRQRPVGATSCWTQGGQIPSWRRAQRGLSSRAPSQDRRKVLSLPGRIQDAHLNSFRTVSTTPALNSWPSPEANVTSP